MILSSLIVRDRFVFPCLKRMGCSERLVFTNDSPQHEFQGRRRTREHGNATIFRGQTTRGQGPSQSQIKSRKTEPKEHQPQGGVQNSQQKAPPNPPSTLHFQG